MNINFAKELHKKLKTIANEKGCSIPALIQSIAKQWIKENYPDLK